MSVIMVEAGCAWCGVEIRKGRKFCSGGHSAKWHAERGPRRPLPDMPARLDVVELPDPSTWIPRAACRGLDGKQGRPDFLTMLKDDQLRLCGRCPVSAQCLDYANACEPEPGIARAGVTYGGLTGPERARMRGLKC